MPDSAPSAIVTAASPAQPAPMPPTINSVNFDKLVAQVVVTMPSVDVDGVALTELTNIKVFVTQSGGPMPSTPDKEFPGGAYPAGSQQTVEVPVGLFNTAYDFEAEVSI